MLVGVPRNDCYEIERLDPSTGRLLSAEPFAVGREKCDLGSAATNGDLLHVVCDGELKSIDCPKGGVIARGSLPSVARWQIEPAADGLLLWTVPAISGLTVAAVFGYMLVAEGWSRHQRTQVITVKDEATGRATTIGWTSFYSPVTPAEGLHFGYETEASLKGENYDEADHRAPSSQ